MEGEDLARVRGFYREKLKQAFCYSRECSQPAGSVAEAVVDHPEFEAMLRDCEAGSFECARRAGEMAVVYLDRAPRTGAAGKGEWWRDLLNYERGWFLQSATIAVEPPSNRPRRGLSAVCMNFSWKLPELIAHLKDGRPIAEDLHQPVTLLFARGLDCRPCVVEVGPTVERVFRATNGLRTVEQIAAAAGVSREETEEVLDALAGAGALELAMSPEEMTRRIAAREER